jgi:hypothetical protein
MDVGQHPNAVRQTIRDKQGNSERGLITVLGGMRNRESTLRGCTTHYRLLTSNSNSVVSLDSVAKIVS